VKSWSRIPSRNEKIHLRKSLGPDFLITQVQTTLSNSLFKPIHCSKEIGQAWSPTGHCPRR
jgi:hypothetical protein